MNCFEWHNNSSDYLDDTLQSPLLAQAEKHLEGCPDCTAHYKHFGLILSALAEQPRAQIPPHIRKAPLAAATPRLESAGISLSHWQRIPWYLRTTLEATGIVALVLFGISSSPKIRSIYEKNIERSLNDFKEGLNTNEALTEGFDPNLLASPDKAPQLARIESEATPQIPKRDQDANEIPGEDESSQSLVHAGQSQLWRFTLKTVSPDELRTQVIHALQELNIPANTQGLAGTQVPGGIEFDLILPQTIVPNIKQALEKIIPSTLASKNLPLGSEIFSWYKVKSRKKLPEGSSKVVIWLSQPN